MSTPLSGLTALSFEELERLAELFSAGRLPMPPSALGLSREGFDDAKAVVGDLQSLAEQKFLAQQVATLLHALATEKRRGSAPDELIEIVVTGPDAAGTFRDTAVVIDELFSVAERSVLVVGFALHQGQTVLGPLADRLDTTDGLEATLCLDVSRKPGDTSREDDVVARFADRFVSQEWPGKRLPKVYFDPRALAPWNQQRAVLHAKCVVVDDAQVLVTSANLTEAAQSRNIELGLLARMPSVAMAIGRHFDLLIRDGTLRQVPLGK